MYDEARRPGAVLTSDAPTTDFLEGLSDQVLRLTGGSACHLLSYHQRTGLLMGDPASDPAGEGRAWLVDDSMGLVERVWDEGRPVLAEGLREPRLSSRVALLAPLSVGSMRVGILLVEAPDPTKVKRAMGAVGDAAQVMALAIERARLQRELALQRSLSRLVTELSSAVLSSGQLRPKLRDVCTRLQTLAGVARVSLWLHDRDAGVLELTACSDSAIALGERLAADDPSIPQVGAMRSVGALVSNERESGTPWVVLALRGRRRALGALELRGGALDVGEDADLLGRMIEFARAFSMALENVWLLEDLVGSRRELSSTFNALTDLVVVADSALRVRLANRAFITRHNRSASSPVGQPVSDFVGPEVVAWIETVAAGAHARVLDQSREIADEALGGTFLFTVSTLTNPASEPAGVVIVARDVTTHARLEAERSEWRNRMAQTEKLAALGQFVAGIAHELNNPLQGVIGHVELMLKDGALPARLRRDLRLVGREADRAAAIVRDLLIFAGSRRSNHRRLNVNTVIQKVLTLRAPACTAAGIAIVRDLAPALPRVAGDLPSLQQALLNIVLNAEQAMAATAPPHALEVRTRSHGPNRIEIEIADSGPGVAPDALPRLFEPFFTTKDVGQGTGLGLAIAYGIVQEHGGVLSVANRATRGAVFTITLPAASDQEP